VKKSIGSVVCARAAALAVLATLSSACNQKAPAPPAPPPAPAPAAQPKPAGPKPPEPPPKLSDTQMGALQLAFKSARQQVEEARKLKREGEAIERSKSRQEANDTYVKAKELYRKATESTEEWIEPDLGKVTAAQVDAYLTAWRDERGKWIKEMSDLGKVHKDD
jgi:hypothetical protein